MHKNRVCGLHASIFKLLLCQKRHYLESTFSSCGPCMSVKSFCVTEYLGFEYTSCVILSILLINVIYGYIFIYFYWQDNSVSPKCINMQLIDLRIIGVHQLTVVTNNERCIVKHALEKCILEFTYWMTIFGSHPYGRSHVTYNYLCILTHAIIL